MNSSLVRSRISSFCVHVEHIPNAIWSASPWHHRRSYHELSYSRHGQPLDVLECQETLNSADNVEHTNMIEVDMIHVPWNPADLNTVQGKYPSPYLSVAPGVSVPTCSSHYLQGRFVAGSEGWGRVVVSASSSIPVGSLVTVAKPGLGTLRSSMWVTDSDILQVPTELLNLLGPAGSTLFQLGGTALRMLTDFVTLQQGDLVIQNAGNSGVGLMVSQLAPISFAAPVVSLVRRGSRSTQEMEELHDYLTVVGKNALVLIEEDLQDSDHRKEIQSKLREFSARGELPKLALNSVGGESSKSLFRLLENGGTLVTYGGMSGKPVSIATPQLIFKDVRATGYWHSRWMAENILSTKQQLVDDLVEATRKKGLTCPPCEVFAVREFEEALKWQSSQQAAIRSKLIFDCR